MRFRVLAGNIFCGTLKISKSGVHIFRNREGNLVNPEYIKGYKSLSLQRIHIEGALCQ